MSITRNSWFVTTYSYHTRLHMDVTDKESILKVKTYIEEKEGKLHVLVNKFVRSIYSWVRYKWLTSSYTSAGQIGPISPFLNNKEAPENKTAESLGTALFNCQSFESWASHSSVNLASIFFVTTAFLGLLAKGSEDTEGYWSSVVNITSISGIIKLAQNHVRFVFLFGDRLKFELFNSNLYKVLLQQCKGCCIASHKTALNRDSVERHSRARKRNCPWSLWVRNDIDPNNTRKRGWGWSKHLAPICEKGWNVGFFCLLSVI